MGMRAIWACWFMQHQNKSLFWFKYKHWKWNVHIRQIHCSNKNA